MKQTVLSENVAKLFSVSYIFRHAATANEASLLCSHSTNNYTVNFRIRTQAVGLHVQCDITCRPWHDAHNCLQLPHSSETNTWLCHMANKLKAVSNIHRVRENKDWQYFGHNFDKFKHIVANAMLKSKTVLKMTAAGLDGHWENYAPLTHSSCNDGIIQLSPVSSYAVHKVVEISRSSSVHLHHIRF